MLPDPPEKDSQGKTIPHNHDAILDSDIVIRRISDKQISEYPNGVRRISSLAFKPSSGGAEGMSVDIEKFIREDGRDPKAWVTTPRWFGSIEIDVGPLRELNLLVGYDPIEEEPRNPYHGQVWGSGHKFSKTHQRALRNNSRWFVPIPGVLIEE